MEAPPAPAIRSGSPGRVALGLVGVLAVAIALHALWRWPLTVAELWTWKVTGGTWGRLYTEVALDRHRPLQPFLVKAMRAIAEREALARLPSAVGAVAGVLALGAAARRVVGPAFAAVPALVLVLSPMWVAWAGIARPYGLLLGLGAGVAHAGLVLPERPRRGALLLALWGGLGLYTHYAMAAPLVGAGLGAALGLLARRDRRGLGWLALAAVAVAFAFLPWTLGPLPGQLGHHRLGAPVGRTLRFLAFEVDDFAPLEQAPLHVLALVGLVALAFGRRLDLLGQVVGGLLAAWALGVDPEFRVRHYVFIGLLPLFALLVGVGARRLLDRPLPWLLGLGALLGPGALELARLPSAPFGPHGDAVDDGVHDARRDMALIRSALPAGVGLVVPFSLEPNIFALYAPGASVLREEEPAAAADWRMLGGRGAPEGAPSVAPGGAAATAHAASRAGGRRGPVDEDR